MSAAQGPQYLRFPVRIPDRRWIPIDRTSSRFAEALAEGTGITEVRAFTNGGPFILAFEITERGYATIQRVAISPCRKQAASGCFDARDWLLCCHIATAIARAE